MLYKKILKNIPPVPLDKIKMGKYKYLGAATVIHDKKCGEILIADIYRRAKPRELLFRFFTDKKTHQIYDVTKDIWRQGSLIYAMSGRSEYYYWNDPEYCAGASAETVKAVREYFNVNYGSDSEIAKYINEFVRELSREKYDCAQERKAERIQKRMDMFPELPDDFDSFLREDVFKKYIFMGKVEKGRKSGICTACGKKVSLEKKIRHKTVMHCPECGAEVTAFEKRYIGSIKERENVCMAHKADNQLIVRWMKVYANWHMTDAGEYIPRYIKDEYFRTMYLHTKNGQKILYFDNKEVWPYGKYWREKKELEDNLSYLYNRNLREVFGEKYYNVDFEKVFRNNIQPLYFIGLLDNLKNLPQTEYLVKMGMCRLASEINQEDMNTGNNFGAILGINPQYKKMYCGMNISLNEHNLVKASSEWVSEEDFLKMRAFRTNDYQAGIICKMLEKMTYRKFVNYFAKQRMIYHHESFSQLLQWYSDYISMSEQMNIDLSHKSVRFPKDIKAAHDRLIAGYSAVKNELLDKQMREASERLYAGLTEYRSGEYAIVFPRTKTEFITEGQSLNHCVGTQERYFNNHIEGTKMIFFIRRADDIETPFVTMEIDMRRLVILQIYGYGDKRPPQPVINFANKFLTQLKGRDDKMQRSA